MYSKAEDAVSPVIATVLLLALGGTIIAMAGVSVLSNADNILVNDVKSVSVSVEIDGNSMTVAPISGKDLKYLESYYVIADNTKLSSGGVSSFEYETYPSAVFTLQNDIKLINVVGNFSDGESAVIYSGNVVKDDDKYTITLKKGDESSGTGAFTTGSHNGLVNSINEWYHKAYPGEGDAVEEEWTGNSKGELKFINNKNIIVGSEPILISKETLNGINSEFTITITGNGKIIRSNGYTGNLFNIGDMFENNGNPRPVNIKGSSTLIIDGNNIDGSNPAVVILNGVQVNINSGGTLEVINNKGIGIQNDGTITVNSGGSLILLDNTIDVKGNDIKNNGGTITNGYTHEA